jgi:hypothetical protein
MLSSAGISTIPKTCPPSDTARAARSRESIPQSDPSIANLETKLLRRRMNNFCRICVTPFSISYIPIM